MSGISSTLSIAKTAIAAQQYGLTVTGNNIANVNNPDYSRQVSEHLNRTPALYAGFLFGTGVDSAQIEQNVDQLLENRLTDEKSSQSAFEEAESYMRILEGYFDENSDASVTSIMMDFWNSWHDLSDNPLGSSERVAVYEKGKNFAARMNTANEDLTTMSSDINNEIMASLQQINVIASQIADLNVQITGLEANRTANDLRDQRNALLDQLGSIINIDTFEQDNGSIIVNAAGGSTLVNGVDHYTLTKEDDMIMWQGSYGADLDITDKISGGKLAGWLQVRDEIIPKFTDELDILAREMIWEMNYQHSQGAGLDYYTGSLTGDYKTDITGFLSGYDFGDKIDYTQDFTMWMQDNSTVNTEYTKTQIDMGISQAEISNWGGTTVGLEQYRYKLTVMDSAVLGDKILSETDGAGLAQVHSSTVDIADALDSGIAEQTLTINNGPSGTQVIEIRDVGGDAQRSAASIAQALSQIDGVDAHASEVSASFDLAGIGAAEDGDEVQFSIYSDGLVQPVSFVRDSSLGSLSDQFENALRQGAQTVNGIRDDLDLFTSGLSISSASGRTLGIQDFEVLDNAGVQINNFTNFNAGDTASFTIDSSGFGGSAATTTNISVTLTSMGAAPSQAQVSAAFYDELSQALADTPFSVVHDPATNSIFLRTTDGSDLTLSNGDSDTGLASFGVLDQPGTIYGGGDNVFQLDGAGTDTEVFNADTQTTDTLEFVGPGSSETIEEASLVGGVKAGVVTGTLTVLMEPGMTMYSTVSAAGGLFAGNWAKTGSSIITFGGENGFNYFTPGETVSFDLDGNPVTMVVGSIAEIDLANDLAAALTAGLPATDYQIIQTGTSVSVLKREDLDTPIEITNFAETGLNADATLSAVTGTGQGTSAPENDLLDASNSFRNFSTSSHYADEGIIKWEKYDSNGIFTGDEGLINVEEEGPVSIVEAGVNTLSFDISEGSLVAGNTLTLNTDTSGNPDPLNFTIGGAANNKNEIYKFVVTTGGKVGELVPDEDIITIEWKTGTRAGTIVLEGDNPPLTPEAPIEVEVDGMKLRFFNGTLFENDAFTITTDERGFPVSENADGYATGELLSDWHWTIDSFAGQFNRQSEGMTAKTTEDFQLKFETSSAYHAVTNIEYSGSNGFNEDNVTLKVLDWGAMDFRAEDLQISRSLSGYWGLVNDPTGGVAAFIPAGGDDDGFGIDFSGDGLADIEVSFAQKASGQGHIQLDFAKRDPDDVSFAFSDDSVEGSSGLLAAVGMNNFFRGSDAMTMAINERLSDTKYVAAARINSETGEISQGDNANALNLADVQYKDITMKQWNYVRGGDPMSSLTLTNLDGYFSTMTGSMGIISKRIQSSREFADIMVNNLTEQRNSVSSVSLDEEMIRLMQYQHAFSAASKLLTVSDEMLNTLISTR